MSTKNNLTNDNYFDVDNQLKYMGSSQFKAFCSCEAQALAELKGEYTREKTTALLVGSYVDAYYEGTLEAFKEEHPEILKKDGELKAEYQQANKIIERAERDNLFKKYMSGQKQVIMTGQIAGVPVKIKIDSYHPDKAIVDLKCVKDMQPIYNSKMHKRINFVDYWGYDIQGTIYQEIVRQNTGKQLPFFLAVATKEKVPDIALLSIGQEELDQALEFVTERIAYYNDVKKGVIEPERCEHCDYCKETKVLEEIYDYKAYLD